MLRVLIVFSLLNFSIFAKEFEILIKDGVTQKFYTDNTKRELSNTVYTGEDLNNSEILRSNSRIVVSFLEDINLEEFAKEFLLEDAIELSKYKQNYSFKNVSGKNDIEVAFLIFKSEKYKNKIRFAKPVFKATRRLY